MGKVNVVLGDGRVVAVDEEDAQALRGANDVSAREASPGETVDYNREQQQAEIRHDVYGGVQGALLSATGGALDTLTLGAGTRIFGNGHSYQEAAKEHPAANLVGSAGAFFLPGVGEASVFTGARAGAEALGAGRIGARVAEGSLAGFGGYVAQSNVTGDPLTIEGAVEGMGIGSVLNLGMGALSDRIAGATWMAKKGVAEAEIQRLDEQLADEGKKVLADPPPSYEDFRQSHSAAVKAGRQLNREIERETNAYNDLVNNNAKLTSAIKDTEDVLNKIRNTRYAPDNANVQYVEGKPRGVQYVYGEGGVDERRVLSASQPPISEDLRARLKGYQERISQIYKQKSGGFELKESGKWVRDPSVPPDPQGALEALRSLNSELTRGPEAFSKASGGLAELPPIPREPVPVSDVQVPKTPRAFARMRPETIAELANSLDPASQEAFAKFAGDIGLEVKPNIAETVAGVHEKLGSYVGAMDRLDAAAEKELADEAKRPLIWRVLKAGARIAGAKVAGAGFGTRFLGSMLGGELADLAMIASREGIREKVQQLVAKWGLPAADAAEKLGPVTAYLGSSFVTGEKDPEKDARRQAANRINEIRGAALTAPDTAFMAVQSLLDMPNGVALKLHNQIVGTLAHLAQMAPQDPGLDVTMFGSNWTPNWSDTIALAHRLEAVQNPLAAIARALGGDSHPAATQTLWAAYPAIMRELASEVSAQADKLKNLTYAQSSGYSNLFRIPITGLQNPAVVTQLQGLYLPKQQGGYGGPVPGAKPARPTGRPAAVQSPVAGSNVSALISQ